MYVVQQPVRVQRTSFHYRWESLKKEASGNLTPSFFQTATSLRSRQVVKEATASTGGITAVQAAGAFNCLDNAVWVEFREHVWVLA